MNSRKVLLGCFVGQTLSLILVIWSAIVIEAVPTKVVLAQELVKMLVLGIAIVILWRREKQEDVTKSVPLESDIEGL